MVLKKIIKSYLGYHLTYYFITKMNGETNLNLLLEHMKPYQNEGEYVFCCIGEQIIDVKEVLFHFKEKEGITIICTKEYAQEKGYNYSSTYAWLTLEVHSSLEAIGLTAAFSNALAKNYISCNVVAGFFHDHIFVPYPKARQALDVLEKINQQ